MASVMTRTLRSVDGPRRLLEVGPGTGAFTKAVLKRLRPGDEFVVVELNQAFCRELDQKLLEPFRRANPDVRVSLHCAPIESAPIHGPFDFIVCGLPFNNFPPALVRQILRRLLSLLRSGGELAYFEYAGVRAMKGPLVGSKSRRELKRIGSYSKALRQRLGGRTEFVLGNFPPCLAVRLPAPSPTNGQARNRPPRPSRTQIKQQQQERRATERAARREARAAKTTAGTATRTGTGTRSAAAKVLRLASKLAPKRGAAAGRAAVRTKSPSRSA